MLKIQGVSKSFGAKTAVADVDLTIAKGEMVGIIGRSGAGKSTLLRMINRLSSPTAGAILADGEDVTRLKGARLRSWQADCAMIFQQFNLVPRLDVLTNVLLGRLNRRATVTSLFKLFTDEERIRALVALERLGIAETALQRAGTLSGGQQQRVAIARALLQQPRYVLADEPIASLDPRNAEIVMRALKDINERDGLTVLTNLHTLDTARAFCSRIVGMAAGRVVFDGRPEELTDSVVRAIYGVTDPDEAFSEAMTSTAIRPARAAPSLAPAAATA